MDTDNSEEILFWMGVYATDCKIKGKRVNTEIVKHPAKLARWHDGLHSAAAEYRMWGNGMALPNALFFIQRLAALYGWSTVKLGSLFDGSGTMPLAAEMCGVRAVWASEVEPYPIAVTCTHLPLMQHLGSVTDIDGGLIEPVNVITFGSPCQDLSIAGRRAGLGGKRSGLFMEAVRIIREMRQATGGLFPRFAIWENVPAHCHRMEERILKPSSTNCCRFPGQTSLFDALEEGGRIQQTTERLPIESSMLNTGESPSAAEESTLSQILMENPPETLFLSEKALHGILNRASRRGKPLPPLLLTAINGVLAWYQSREQSGLTGTQEQP